VELEIRLICGTAMQFSGENGRAALQQITAAMTGSRATEDDYQALVNRGDGAAVLRAMEDILDVDAPPVAISLVDREGYTNVVPLSSISYYKHRG